MTTATKTQPAKAPARKRAPRKPKPAAPPPAPTVLNVPALQFARAWGWVITAASTDTYRPVLCSVSIEIYDPESVRLAATSSYELLHCWVSEGDDPGTDAPVPGAVLVQDGDRRLTALLKFVARTSGAMDRLRIEVRDATVLFATDTETVIVPRCAKDDGTLDEFPNWRSLLGQVGGTSGTVTHSLRSLRWMANLKQAGNGSTAQRGPRMTPSVKPLGPIGLAWPWFEPPLYGLVMPVRDGES